MTTEQRLERLERESGPLPERDRWLNLTRWLWVVFVGSVIAAIVVDDHYRGRSTFQSGFTKPTMTSFGFARTVIHEHRDDGTERVTRRSYHRDLWRRRKSARAWAREWGDAVPATPSQIEGLRRLIGAGILYGVGLGGAVLVSSLSLLSSRRALRYGSLIGAAALATAALLQFGAVANRFVVDRNRALYLLYDSQLDIPDRESVFSPLSKLLLATWILLAVSATVAWLMSRRRASSARRAA